MSTATTSRPFARALATRAMKNAIGKASRMSVIVTSAAIDTVRQTILR